MRRLALCAILLTTLLSLSPVLAQTYGPNVTTAGGAIGSGLSQYGAFDGFNGVYWTSNTGATSGVSWIGQDFGGTARHVRRYTVKQYSAGYTVSSVALQWSDDNSTYYTLQTDYLSNDNALNTFDVIASAAHRYWRILAQSNTVGGGAYNWLIDNIEMFEMSATPVPPTNTPLPPTATNTPYTPAPTVTPEPPTSTFLPTNTATITPTPIVTQPAYSWLPEGYYMGAGGQLACYFLSPVTVGNGVYTITQGTYDNDVVVTGESSYIGVTFRIPGQSEIRILSLDGDTATGFEHANSASVTVGHGQWFFDRFNNQVGSTNTWNGPQGAYGWYGTFTVIPATLVEHVNFGYSGGLPSMRTFRVCLDPTYHVEGATLTPSPTGSMTATPTPYASPRATRIVYVQPDNLPLCTYTPAPSRTSVWGHTSTPRGTWTPYPSQTPSPCPTGLVCPDPSTATPASTRTATRTPKGLIATITPSAACRLPDAPGERWFKDDYGKVVDMDLSLVCGDDDPQTQAELAAGLAGKAGGWSGYAPPSGGGSASFGYNETTDESVETLVKLSPAGWLQKPNGCHDALVSCNWLLPHLNFTMPQWILSAWNTLTGQTVNTADPQATVNFDGLKLCIRWFNFKLNLFGMDLTPLIVAVLAVSGVLAVQRRIARGSI